MATKKPTKNGAVPKAERAAAASYFLSLSLENVRCFGPKQTLDLSDGKGKPARWTILLGNNGTGKTTVLQALARFGLVRRVQTGIQDRVSEQLVSVAASSILNDSISIWLRNGSTTGTLQSTFSAAGDLISMEGEIKSIHALLSLFAGLAPLVHGSANLMCAPRSVGYGAGRRLNFFYMFPRNGEPDAEDDTANLFSDRADVRNAEEWLLQLDYAVSKNPNDARQRERFGHIKDLLLRIMPEGEVEDIRCVAGSGTHPQPKVEFQTPYGWVPLRQLGYGYQTLIAWMVDFASRMVERYPDSTDPLAEPAVVLVDEIDLHLHPTWQRKLIGFLTERFPNTQFIATAHSPLVVQAATDANIAVLRREGDHVVIDQSYQGMRNWSIEQLLTSDLFGVESPWPAKFDKLIARRTELKERAKLSKTEKAELKQLDEQFSELPAGRTAKEAEEIRELTRKTQELLEKYHAQRS